MTSLLSLPREILSEIASWTLPDSIEAFAISCKTIYACASSQIRRHNALNKYWGRKAGASADLLFCLFCDSEVDPLAAKYIRDLDLWHADDDRNDGDCNKMWLTARAVDVVNDNGAQVPRDNLEGIERVLTESRFLRDAKVDADQWWATIKRANWDEKDEFDEERQDVKPASKCVVSLLGLLPNLVTLTLPKWVRLGSKDEDGETTLAVLDAMVKSSNGRKGALARLETIMPFCAAGYESKAALQTVEPFLKLEALREMFLVSCLAIDDGYTGKAFHWRSEELSSRLKRIELAHCCMDAEGISQLVAHTPELEIFKYSHETKWHGCGHDWNAGAFVEAIGRHAGSTITQLAVTIDLQYGEIENGVASFNSFSKLKDLEFDIRIFYGPPMESGQMRGLTEQLPKEEQPWNGESFPSLASVLPSSTTSVQINAESLSAEQSDAQPLRALLKQFEQDRRTRLKDLNRVIVSTFDGHAAKAIIEATGANVEIYCASDADVQTGLSSWKREFEQRAGRIQRD